MKREEILSVCLDEILSGQSTLKDCLLKYPYLRDELEPLIAIGLSIHSIEAAPSPEFKQQLRRRLLASPQPKRGILDCLKPTALLRRARLSLIALGLVPVFALGGTTVYAYERSLPDETLYPLKRVVETIEISLAPSPEKKAVVHLKMAERRADEIVKQATLGRSISATTVTSAADQLDSALREISAAPEENAKPLLDRLSRSTLEQHSRLNRVLETAPEPARPALQQAIGATRRGNLIAEITAGNAAFLSRPPSVSDARLEEAHFRLEGALISISGRTWNVNGVVLQNVNASPSAANALHRGVRIEGVVRQGQIYIGKIEIKDKPGNEFKLRGVFTGASPDGATWYVGGVSVARPENVPAPTPGKDVTIEGSYRDPSGKPPSNEGSGRGTGPGRTPAATPATSPSPSPSPRPPAPSPSPMPTASPPPTTPAVTPSPTPTRRPVATPRPEPTTKKDDDRKGGDGKDRKGDSGNIQKPSPTPVDKPTPGPAPTPRRDDTKDSGKSSDGQRKEPPREDAKDGRTGTGTSPGPPPGEQQRRDSEKDGNKDSGGTAKKDTSEKGKQGSDANKGDNQGDSKGNKESSGNGQRPGPKKD